MQAKSKKNGKKLAEESFVGLPEKVTKLLESESDRGAILILSAYLEEILGLIVRASCVSDAEADNLLEFRRPAGDFDSKISLCNAFALISPDEREALNCVRKIRNQAAHFDKKGGRGFDVLFDSAVTVDFVTHLAKSLNHRLTAKDAKGVRQAFTALGRFLAIRLYFRLLESERPAPLKSLREIANALRVQMKDTVHGKQLAEVEKLAKEGKPEKLYELFESTKDIFQAVAKKMQDVDSSDPPTSP